MAADRPLVVLLDQHGASEAGATCPAARSAVYFARVDDPAKLVEERSLVLHGDVIDALVGLVLELVDSEGVNGKSTAGR